MKCQHVTQAHSRHFDPETAKFFRTMTISAYVGRNSLVNMEINLDDNMEPSRIDLVSKIRRKNPLFKGFNWREIKTTRIKDPARIQRIMDCFHKAISTMHCYSDTGLVRAFQP